MRRSRRAEGKFYTSPSIAEKLVELVPGQPTAILDLCCGPGALAKAASARWSPEELVTIDTDVAVSPVFAHHECPGHRHLTCDALRIAAEADSLPAGGFDLVLTNPPFGYREHCAGLVASVDRALSGRGSRTVTAEMAAIAQALWFTKPGGTVAAIVPDTMVAGSRAAWFRGQVLGVAVLVRAVALPPRAFPGTDARTHLIILRKNAEESAFKIGELPIGSWTSVALRDLEASNLAAAPPSGGGRTLAELGVRVDRGVVNASKARNEKRPVFHTDGFAAASGDGRLALPEGEGHENCVLAMPGDILLARVDRKLEEKIARVSTGALQISDCIYRLRGPQEVLDRVWEGLRSPIGKANLVAGVRGVSARHLPKYKLLATPIP